MGAKMTAQKPFANMGEMFKHMPKVDKEEMMKSHRKNIEALSEAHTKAVDVMKSISQLQNEYMKKAFEDFSSSMKDAMKSKGKEAVEKHTTNVKAHLTNAVEHGKTISTTLAKTQKEIFDLMHDRYKEGMDELKSLHNKAATKH
jgi:phasin family protein